MLKKIESNPKIFAIFYGAIGSIAASAIWALAPPFGDWLAHSSWGVLVDFVNTRYARAATLQPLNYSFFMITIGLVVCAVLWLEIATKAKKVLLGTGEHMLPAPKAEPPRLVKTVAYIFIRFVIPLYILYALIQLAGEVIVLNAITDFKQHLRIVTPHLDINEKDLILSQWSQMRTIDDYNKIYERLVAVAHEKNIKLYKNHMY